MSWSGSLREELVLGEARMLRRLDESPQRRPWEALAAAIPATSQDNLELTACDWRGKCVPESRCDFLKGNKG